MICLNWWPVGVGTKRTACVPPRGEDILPSSLSLAPLAASEQNCRAGVLVTARDCGLGIDEQAAIPLRLQISDFLMMQLTLVAILLLLLFFAAFVAVFARRRNIHVWIGSYLWQLLRRQPKASPGPVHLFVCLADHFEPAWNGVSIEEERARVDAWMERYPELAGQHRDWDGRHPQHTFFYPEEEYRPEHLERLTDLCRRGFGDVEIHLHHDNDTAQGLREKLIRFKTLLHERHGLLHGNPETSEVEFAFIHGDWALDNSRRDGRMCGVNNELTVLRECGCYADLTLPSAPSETQTTKINSIYYAQDDPLLPKSHNGGCDVTVGGKPWGDLLIIQGPLTLDWRSRKWGLLPRIVNGELTGTNPPVPHRIDLWIRQNVHVHGQPNWVFVKLHTHGTQEVGAGGLLGPKLEQMWSYLESTYNDGQRYRLHYVTAWEMYRLVKAAEAGRLADPSEQLAELRGSAPPTGQATA